jgi:hypothetical protein
MVQLSRDLEVCERRLQVLDILKLDWERRIQAKIGLGSLVKSGDLLNSNIYHLGVLVYQRYLVLPEKTMVTDHLLNSLKLLL